MTTNPEMQFLTVSSKQKKSKLIVNKTEARKHLLTYKTFVFYFMVIN